MKEQKHEEVPDAKPRQTSCDDNRWEGWRDQQHELETGNWKLSQSSSRMRQELVLAQTGLAQPQLGDCARAITSLSHVMPRHIPWQYQSRITSVSRTKKQQQSLAHAQGPTQRGNLSHLITGVASQVSRSPCRPQCRDHQICLLSYLFEPTQFTSPESKLDDINEMQAYAEVLPPSGVTAALALAFTSPHASNLLLARTSLLQVFSQNQLPGGQDSNLVLIAEYTLPGTITHLGKLKLQTSKSGGDAVLIALRDAKLSLIEWDPTLHSISTLSIHYYEQDTLQTAPWQTDLGRCVTHLTVDPSSRCAAFNFGVNNLAIVPFHQTSDDLAMDDDFDDANDTDGLAPKDQQAAKSENGTSHDTPYYPSFVLPTTALDPGLLHPIDLAFLHEYRDPTVGILYSTAARSSNMVAERKDVTIYAVYALDLEQKASTALQSVQKLPNDVQQIIPLPLPVGGALLIGGNELIHVDQGGKSSAIAVNDFTRDTSTFPMTDQSDLRLKLEGCRIEHLGNPNGDMLIILHTGEFALLTFRMDGRSLSSMTISRIDDDHASALALGPASCTANLGQGNLFIGSEESDSIVLATSKKASQLKRTLSRAQVQGNGVEIDVDEEEDVDLEDEDDLYADPVDRVNGAASGDLAGSGGLHFRVLDQLCSIAPINDTTFGLLGKRKRGEDDDLTSEDPTQGQKRLVASYGRGKAGGVAFICKELDLDISKRLSFPESTKVWCFSSLSKTKARMAGEALPTDDLMIVSQSPSNSEGKSSLLRSVKGDFQPRPDSEFDGSAGATVFVGKLDMTNHTVQVLSTEVRVYDAGKKFPPSYPSDKN